MGKRPWRTSSGWLASWRTWISALEHSCRMTKPPWPHESHRPSRRSRASCKSSSPSEVLYRSRPNERDRKLLELESEKLDIGVGHGRHPRSGSGGGPRPRPADRCRGSDRRPRRGGPTRRRYGTPALLAVARVLRGRHAELRQRSCLMARRKLRHEHRVEPGTARGTPRRRRDGGDFRRPRRPDGASASV